MDFSINVPYRQKIVFQVQIQKNSVPCKNIDLPKAAAKQNLHKTLEQEIDNHRDKFFLLR